MIQFYIKTLGTEVFSYFLNDFTLAKIILLKFI